MMARWTQRNPRWTWLMAVALLVFADQLSKSYFLNTLEPGEAFNLANVFIVCAALICCLASFKAPPRQPICQAPEEMRS